MRNLNVPLPESLLKKLELYSISAGIMKRKIVENALTEHLIKQKKTNNKDQS
jgi:metal-responsive CopG/Arc/MetJ family transcriptional regulator